MGNRRILINALSLTRAGGSRSYLLNLLRELDRDSRGFDFTVLVASGQLAAAEARGIEVSAVSLPRAPAAARVLLRVLYEEAILPIRASRFDLLYCVADLAPVFGGAPTVVTLRNMQIYDHRFYDNLRLHALDRLVRLGARRARRLIFPSRAAAELISQRIPIPEQRIAVVPHGVSSEAFDTELATAAEAPAYLFLAASLERHKNIETLIRSLSHLDDDCLEVWLAGSETVDPQYARELHQLAESLGLAARVRFLGQVSYGEILPYYRGAVAFVLPSLLETFGHPLLEAMLAEAPIVAVDAPVFREIAGDVALYFPPQDPAGLARCVEQVRREPEATRARVASGRARAEQCSWKKSVDRLCAVFEAVLRGD